jgi:hypothetical protein
MGAVFCDGAELGVTDRGPVVTGPAEGLALLGDFEEGSDVGTMVLGLFVLGENDV